MVTAAALTTTLGIIDASARVLTSDKTTKAINRTAGAAAKVMMAGTALTAYTSQTTILSRLFLEDGLVGEPVLPHLMKVVHEWYAAQIISALQLTQMVDSFRTVQDVMAIVQTGHNVRERGVLGNIAQRRMGQESFLENYHGEAFVPSRDMGLEDFALEALQPGHMGPPTKQDIRDKMKDEIADAKLADEHRNVTSNNWSASSVKSVKGSENRIGPMGELFEVKLSNPNGNGQSLTVPVFVQMQPSLIPTQLAPRFVDLNVSPNLWQRWTMMRAGELTFWKDFLLQRDQAKRMRSVLKDPEAAKAFQDYLRTIAKKDAYALGDATDQLSARQSSNLANSVVILSEDTVHQAKLDSGIDLHNPMDRQRYFRSTYTMILVIIDPLHQRVTTCFNGLDGEINSSYSDFRPQNKDFDQKEFMQAMQAFSTNNISRMR